MFLTVHDSYHFKILSWHKKKQTHCLALASKALDPWYRGKGYQLWEQECFKQNKQLRLSH